MRTKSEERFLKDYEKPLHWPVWRFISVYGLSWGIIVMLLTAGFEFLIDNAETNFTPRYVALRIGGWLVGGVVYGLWFRTILLQRYRKIKGRDKA